MNGPASRWWFPWRETAWAVAFVLGATALYAGSFYALLDLDGARSLAATRSRPRWLPVNAEAQYVAGGEFAVRFYRPMERLDRVLRPGMWE